MTPVPGALTDLRLQQEALTQAIATLCDAMHARKGDDWQHLALTLRGLHYRSARIARRLAILCDLVEAFMNSPR